MRPSIRSTPAWLSAALTPETREAMAIAYAEGQRAVSAADGADPERWDFPTPRAAARAYDVLERAGAVEPIGAKDAVRLLVAAGFTDAEAAEALALCARCELVVSTDYGFSLVPGARCWF